MSGLSLTPPADREADLKLRRAAMRKASAAKTKAERALRRQQYRALCNYTPPPRSAPPCRD